MSQAGQFLHTSGGGTPIETITGNSGGPVGPDGANNINVLGDTTTINIVGNPGTNTLTVSTTGTVPISFPTDSGTATPALGILDVFGDSHNITTTGSGHQIVVGLTGITQHSLQVGGAANALTQLGVATNGQLPIGSTGADPVLATLTAGTGISVTNGAGSISLAVNGAVVGQTITGDSGGALSPTAGNWNFTGGSTGLTFAGAGSTETLGGTLAIANGGTDATSFTQSNGIVTYNGTRLVNYAGPQISSGGVQTNTTQPAFGAYNSVAVANVTGDGTSYKCSFDSKAFDNGTNFNTSTYTFTAPVSGPVFIQLYNISLYI